MDDVKVSVSIILPGRVMYKQEECVKEVNGKLVDDFNMNDSTVIDIMDNNGKRKSLHIHTRKCIPASKGLNLSRDAYNYMISESSCLPYMKQFQWSHMTKERRLEEHLKNIAEQSGGYVQDYEVFKD